MFIILYLQIDVDIDVNKWIILSKIKNLDFTANIIDFTQEFHILLIVFDELYTDYKQNVNKFIYVHNYVNNFFFIDFTVFFLTSTAFFYTINMLFS